MAVTKSGTGRKLEGLGRLLMGFDVQDGIFCESFSSKHCGIDEKRDLFLWHFSRKFDSGVEIVCSFNKPIYLFCVAIPKGENVIYETFPFSWLGFAFLDWFRFSFRHENIGEWHGHFRTHSGSMCLEEVLLVELKRIFFNPYLHIFYFCSERFEVNSVVELHFGLFYFFWIIRDDCRLLYLCLLFWGLKQSWFSTLLEPWAHYFLA